jgi:putative membrane protein
MHIGSHYKLKEFLRWTRHAVFWLLIIATVPTVIYEITGWQWMGIPWVPVALVGTAAAFIAGFRNTQTYNRTWEARMIWGAIVNSSRTWGIMVKDFVRNNNLAEEKQIHQQLIYRHIAWLTALRFQLRESKSWENVKTKPYNIEYSQHYKIPEWESNLADELRAYLSEEERQYVLEKKNRATQILALQSKQLKELHITKDIDALCYVEMENVLKDF